MVARFVVVLTLMLFAAGCEKHAGYGETVSVSESGAVWEVKLNKSFHNEKAVLVELEYTNRAGPAFSIKPNNVVLRDDQGNFWVADGRFPLIPLLQPGETRLIRTSFSDAVVTKGPLYLSPLDKLAHKAPVILLKAKGDTPLPGNHENERWDVAQ
jgi:hypothetical protein